MHQAADVSTLAANYPKINLGQFNAGKFKLADGYKTQPAFYLLAAAGFFIQAFAINFYGRVGGWILLYIAGKLRAVITQLFFGKLANVEFIILLRFHIVRWRGCAQYHGTGIFLFFGLEGVNLLGHFTGADDKQPGGQRIKCAGMANL